MPPDMPAREIAARRAEHDDAAAGHVFAAVIADGFDDRVHAAVAHREAFAGHAADVDLAARSRHTSATLPTMMFSSGTKVEPFGGIDDDLAAATGLCRSNRWRRLRARSVMPRGMNAPKLWPAEPLNLNLDRVLGQARRRRTCCVISLPVIVPTTRLTLRIGSSARDLLAALDRRLAQLEQRRDVQRLVEAVILLDLAEAADLRCRRRLIQDVAEKSRPLAFQ